MSNRQTCKQVAGYSEQEDKILMEKAKNGDQGAFSVLVERYNQTVAATVIGMLGPGEDAEDVGQNVFIRFYRSMNDFRGEAALGTYLTRIAINLSINELKKRQRRNSFFYRSADNQIELEIEDNQNQGSEVDTREVVNKALNTLEPKFRSVVVLRLIQGYSTRETAQILNLPLGTVLSRLARAQDKLREILKYLIE
nr:sigma-70 family RNA polymerase sigma factor [Bacteroidota bacterium]